MRTDKNAIDVTSVGSPVIEQVAMVDEAFLSSIDGKKGGMELVDAETLVHLLEALPEPPVNTPGGSAGNTAFALARLGVYSRFIDVVGDDASGGFYRDMFAQVGGDIGLSLIRKKTSTARCLNLVTPDGERTMRTYLGASATLCSEDIAKDDFSGCGHVHIEGYLLFKPVLMRHVLQTAKTEGCTTSVDLWEQQSSR